MLDTNSKFYITATKMLNDYVANGGNVDDLGVHSEIYKFIKNTPIKAEDGSSLKMEQKFELLGFPRKPKYKDNKQELIAEIDAYKQAGGSFHITRKKLPFYPRLHAYSTQLGRQGVDMTYEQIMKGLGYKDYSDTYFRCKDIFELKKYRDEDGFVDSYRKNEKLKAYITALGQTLDLPYYLVITLLADEKLEKCYIDTEYVKQVQIELQQYVKVNGSLNGIRRGNQNLYYKFRTLMRYYGDGSEIDLTSEDWLNIFGLGDVKNRFRTESNKEVDIKPIMYKLKAKFGKEIITIKDIDSKEYRLLLQKAVKLAIPIKELFRNYDLNYDGNTVNRLSTMQVKEIPYLNEMKKLRDNLLKVQGITNENGYCKEEIFEARVNACKQAYNKFKDKMFNFTIDEINLKDEKLDL